MDDLWIEIQEGESTLEIVENKVYRSIAVALIKISSHEGKTLWEFRQIFDDGSIRERNINGVVEKFKKKEGPLTAAIRGVWEELGISVDPDNVKGCGTEVSIKKSPSYPGLLNHCEAWRFSLIIPIKFYNPNGYVEVQIGKKTTYFVWREVDQ